MSAADDVALPIPAQQDEAQPPAYNTGYEAKRVSLQYKALKEAKVCPTPRLRNLVDEIITAAAHHDRDSTTSPGGETDLMKMVKEFQAYWKALMSDSLTLMIVLGAINSYKKYFHLMLAKDYTSVDLDSAWDSSHMHQVSRLLGSAEEQAEALDFFQNDSLETARFIWIELPLEQLCVDIDHVSSKLQDLRLSGGQPRSKVDKLVEDRKYHELAHVLTKDKHLLSALVMGDIVSAKFYQIFSRGIERVQQENFRYMLDETQFEPRS